MRICIDPGHGGFDSGAVNPSLGDSEKDVVLSYGRCLAQTLKDEGYDVIMTRYTDIYIPLDQRCEIANGNGNTRRSDIFVSIHCNGHKNISANGWEVWTSPGITGADDLASSLYDSVEKEFPYMHMRPDWSDGDPDKEAKFRVLMGTWMPAVLVELGFISNDRDLRNMKNHTWRRRMLNALSRGIKEYFEKKE